MPTSAAINNMDQKNIAQSAKIIALPLMYGAAFGLLFFLQVGNQWQKYLAKETTTTFVSKEDPDLVFPTVAVCPTFNTKRMTEELGLPKWYDSMSGQLMDLR